MTERVAADAAAADLLAALASGDNVLIATDPTSVEPALVSRLAAALADGIGSVSPVPVAGHVGPVLYSVHPAAPPAPSLALPCRSLCLISAAAVGAAPVAPGSATTAAALLTMIGEQMLAHGWRHVACPGVGLEWDPADARATTPAAAWSERAIASLVGDANSGLEAHRSWAAAITGSLRVVIDGACMTTQPYTGTQHLVIEISRWMQRVRPDRHVALAVPSAVVGNVGEALDGTGVEVVDRASEVDADVLYRPYQMLFARELDFVTGTGRRRLIGQLDMIGFANPYYHPSEQLFFFARNIQRHLMRVSDGVTFISHYGRDSTYAEVPDLSPDRLHVVSCGADPVPRPGRLAPTRDLDEGTPFLVCLASTFWHKNRAHAIATLAALGEAHGYRGHLVIAGPEPYYGRSTDAEDALIAGLPPDVAARVHRWGHVDEDEKWWLLEHADAALYPSVVEGFGLIPFEAAAAGTPCLAYAGTAQGELLGGTHAVIGSWAPAAWAERLHGWICDPASAATVVAEIREIATEHTWERSAVATWDAIDSALAAPRRIAATEDGSRLARVAHSVRPSPAAALRFDLARGVPAARRRATGLIRRMTDRIGT